MYVPPHLPYCHTFSTCLNLEVHTAGDADATRVNAGAVVGARQRLPMERVHEPGGRARRAPARAAVGASQRLRVGRADVRHGCAGRAPGGMYMSIYMYMYVCSMVLCLSGTKCVTTSVQSNVISTNSRHTFVYATYGELC
jgi:hypothetical protein